MPIERFEWDRRLLSARKEVLAKRFGMTVEELESYMADFFCDAVDVVEKDQCVAFIDREGKVEKIYEMPVMEIKRNKPSSITDLLGLVLDKENEKYGRISKLVSYDWEHGNFSVRFSDRSESFFPDSRTDKFAIYYRKPWFMNRHGNPTYRLFAKNFIDVSGDLDRLKEDYIKLFDEPLPSPEFFSL